jgi:hypothetical protein
MQSACTIMSSVAYPALQYFSTFSHKRHDFWKTVLKIKCVLIFSITSVWNISHSKTNWARYDQTCILVFKQSSRYSFQNWMKPEISRQSFEKYSYVEFHENPPSGNRSVPFGRTDMTKLTVAIRNLRKRLKTCLVQNPKCSPMSGGVQCSLEPALP